MLDEPITAAAAAASRSAARADRPEATSVVDRAMDFLADELGIDSAELRRRPFLPRTASRTSTRRAC